MGGNAEVLLYHGVLIYAGDYWKSRINDNKIFVSMISRRRVVVDDDDDDDDDDDYGDDDDDDDDDTIVVWKQQL